VTLPLAVAAAAALAWALTWAVRHYALARDVLDHPNERSSHVVPTPRGGGVAIVLVTLAFEAGLGVAGWLSPGEALALAGGGVAVAAVGWWDDHGGVRASARAAVHFAAAAWALWWLGGLPELWVGTGRVTLGVAGAVLSAFGIVWSTNLYNFMDGIDGIAGGEAVTAALAGGVLLLAVGERGLGAVALVLMAASAGFLAWNWAPARIFMGDVGSYFLGFTFAVLAVASERAEAVPLLAWMILLGVFVFDATATLLRRLRRRERFFEAHRSHAYQRAARARGHHARVSGTVVALNLVLAALAAVGTLRPRWLLPAVGVGLLILAAAYVAVERRWPMAAPARA
jgi:Fuc2NAc and GlcNAc transferase